jgi:D-glycero-D-manno-heptose 1,7-bisphosphate phosphatase
MLVLLDRDGVINRDDKTGILRVKDFAFLPGAPQAIARLTQAGFRVAVCTNQSAVGRGHLSVAELDAIHAVMCAGVEEAGGRIDRVYYAPDVPEAPTPRRKPGPGMLQEALAHFGADAARTPMVGDMLRDMEAAHAAGCPRILVRTGKGAHTEAQGMPPALQPIAVVDDLDAAVTHILAHYAGA